MSLILAICGPIAALAAVGFLYQWIGATRDRRRFGAHGRWVEIGEGSKLFLRERGAGEPAVIFEAGIAATNLNWFHVQERIAQLTRTVSYDRGGLGWSSPCRTPRTPANVAAELHAMLERAEIQPPYVLVGHSFGGLVMRRFALNYPGEVAAVVMVDPMRCEEWPPLDPGKQTHVDRGKRMTLCAVPIARLGLARLGVTSLLLRGGALWRVLAGMTSEGPQYVLGRVRTEIAKIPREVLPIVAAHWSHPRFYKGMYRHLAAIPKTVEEMKDAEPIRGIPVRVLTPDRVAPLAEDRLRQIGDNVRQIIVPESAHWIHLDQPEIVVEAIQEMMENAAGRKPEAVTA